MKFLHLYEAINSSGVDAKLRQPVKAADPRIGKPSNPQRRQDRTIGGIPRSPVNRQAAIVTSKASWIHRPPINDMKGNQVVNPNGNDLQSWHVDGHGQMVTENGQKVAHFGNVQLVQSEIHRKEYCKAQEKFKDDIYAMERSLTEARHAVITATKQLVLATNDALSELRSVRMPIVSEVAQCLPALRELRQFFIGADHSVEMARLREFVDLCERLQKLKESGFLDSVADTMLNLSIGDASK